MTGVFLVMRSPRAALSRVTQPQAPPRSYESSHCRALFTVAKEGNSSHLWDLESLRLRRSFVQETSVETWRNMVRGRRITGMDGELSKGQRDKDSYKRRNIYIE
ncbi:hypothetical protein E2C01_043116 [Portunus trituberculatus]|uniref:Uncharacterized protein n=1 Tax=Portunus trituberculatus TaxID=210409 RepID=A0A5B7FWM5_PORTR|nr:hypothetical protein [Portunus trituberculatus]